jgi:hypothetical protein
MFRMYVSSHGSLLNYQQHIFMLEKMQNLRGVIKSRDPFFVSQHLFFHLILFDLDLDVYRHFRRLLSFITTSRLKVEGRNK